MRDKTDIIGWSVVVLLLAVALAFGWVSLVAGLALFLLALIALYLLQYRPDIYLLVMVFFFYGGFRIIDTEVVFRIPGLFKAKDIFLLGWAGYWLIREIMRLTPKQPSVCNALRKSPLTKVFWVLAVLGGIIVAYTVVYLKEPPMLAFRTFREFFSYFWPFLAFRLLDRKQLDNFFKSLMCLVFVGIIFSVLRGGLRGADTTGSASQFGVVRFQNVLESLAFASLIFFAIYWFISGKLSHMFRAGIFVLSMLAFMYRARIAGLCLGIFMTLFFLKGKERGRLMLVVAIAPFAFTILLGLYGMMAGEGFSGYIANFFDFFLAIGDDSTSGVDFRREMLATRLPLMDRYPVFGIGFLGPRSGVAWSLYYQGYMPMGFVDAGWADLLLKYGYVGMPILLGVYVMSAVLAVKRYFKSKGPMARAANLSIFSFVILSFCTLYSFNYMGFEAVYITFVLLNMLGFSEYHKEQESLPEAA